jgi:hypothetical protein
MVRTLAEILSWESFRELLQHGYNNLSLPSSDNTSLFYDLAYFHASTDPLIFAIRASLLFAFICWFQSMATGTHSWVRRHKPANCKGH